MSEGWRDRSGKSNGAKKRTGANEGKKELLDRYMSSPQPCFLLFPRARDSKRGEAQGKTSLRLTFGGSLIQSGGDSLSEDWKAPIKIINGGSIFVPPHAGRRVKTPGSCFI